MSKRKKRPSVADQHGKKKRSSAGGTRWGILILLGIAIVAFIYSSIPKATPNLGPQFTKEGVLTITRGENELASLDIEIADTREDITRGLMYRKSMEEDQGMLFLMETEETQSFWMLNTYISLDIIFIDNDRKIVNVAENTTPLSRESVSSTGPARYVLEVNAGYAQRKELQTGDTINW